MLSSVEYGQGSAANAGVAAIDAAKMLVRRDCQDIMRIMAEGRALTTEERARNKGKDGRKGRDEDEPQIVYTWQLAANVVSVKGLRPGSAPEEPGPFQLPEGGVELAELEVELIKQALERAEDNRTRAAKLLGLTRDQLRYRLEKFGLA